MVPLLNRRDLLRVNPGEIIFDVLLVLYAEFFLYTVAAPGGSLVGSLSADGLFITGILIDFFIIWYLGISFTRFLNRTENPFILVGVAAMGLWLVVSLHFGIAINIGDILGGTAGNRFFFLGMTWGAPLVIIGIGGGVVFAFTEPKAARGEAVLHERALALQKLFPLGMLTLGAGIAWRVVKHLHFGGIILGIVIWALVVAAAWALPRAAEAAFNRQTPGARDRAASVFMAYLFPVILATLVCLWDEIYLWGRLTPALREGTPWSAAGMVAYFFGSGIIPLRILMVLEPPVSIITAVTGLASLGFFIWQVLILVRGLFA